MRRAPGPLIGFILLALSTSCTSRGLGVPELLEDLGITDLAVGDLASPAHKKDMATPFFADMATHAVKDMAIGPVKDMAIATEYDLLGAQTDFELTVAMRGRPEVSHSCDDYPVSPDLASMVGNTYTLSVFFGVNDLTCVPTSGAWCPFTVQQLSLTPDNPLLPPTVATSMVGQGGTFYSNVAGSSAYVVFSLDTTSFGFTTYLDYAAMPGSKGPFALAPFSIPSATNTSTYATSGSDEIEFDNLSAELK